MGVEVELSGDLGSSSLVSCFFCIMLSAQALGVFLYLFSLYCYTSVMWIDFRC